MEKQRATDHVPKIITIVLAIVLYVLHKNNRLYL
nr:MAG TPA: hypothetical protein [Caudoviricetes sp.]DAL04592.1 MAG TPA: hypothetical protein [Caudoviricetes sp.]DAS74274.1 MAG TPA: hypothetical protein [Caudoviricetes sp.]